MADKKPPAAKKPPPKGDAYPAGVAAAKAKGK